MSFNPSSSSTAVACLLTPIGLPSNHSSSVATPPKRRLFSRRQRSDLHLFLRWDSKPVLGALRPRTDQDHQANP
ncbi:hypothetical protein LENED_004856 [Lentinula edodes]|uniref:Uncharacterized protein n=1 Tax=Lentinula edodes TaxID=5353 RepID=A0A1Q3E7C8_LENED|nr:hypothetical protein LENED_004856 [Lentinula edodes]